MYSATFVEIYPDLLSKILASYKDDEYWVHLHRQVQANEDLGDNKVLLPFVTGCSYRLDSDPYILPRPENSTNPSSETVFLHSEGPVVPSPGFRETTPHPGNSTVVIENSMLPLPDKTKLLYHVNRTTGNLWLYIPPVVASDILQIAHGEGYPGFSHCYEIVTHFWYIWSLNRLLREFIWHCPQCLQLQIRQYCPYRSWQFIKSPPISFFTLTLDFVFALPLTMQDFNAIMSVICKFLKQVTLIKGADTWSVEQ